MYSRRFDVIVSSLLLLALLAACGSLPAGSSSKSAAPNQPASAAAATNPPLIAATATTPPVSASAGNGNCTNAYYPVSSGSNWSYSSSGGTLGSYTYTTMVSAMSNTGFTTSNQSSLGTGGTSDVKWTCKDGKLAAFDAGSNSLTMSTSKMKVTSTSITADGYNIPNNFTVGTTWSEKVTINDTVQSGARSVDSRIESTVDCSAAGAESVTVPAGTFDAVKVTCTDTVAVSELMQATAIPAGAPTTVNVTDWYAKGVGLVKSVRASTAGGTDTTVLTQYKIQ